MRIIAVDPGAHAIGWAIFNDGTLYDCGYAPTQEIALAYTRCNGVEVDVVVIEIPQIYQQRKQKGRQKDLVSCAITAGFTSAIFGKHARKVEFVVPRTWKGTTPKKIDNTRTRSLLSPYEQSILDAIDVVDDKRHNVVDAIGIGLWKAGRR